MSCHLALVQMRVEGGARHANLARAAARIAQAADQGAHVVLLPEALDLGWTHPSATTDASPIPEGETATCLREAARRHRVHVCAGLIEQAGPARYNAALLIGPTGDLLLHHRKLNELEIGHPCYQLGDRLGVAPTPHGTFGLMICADAFAPGQIVSRTLALMGADVILSPCAWAVPADHDQVREPYGQLWRDHYGPVARDYRLWIAGCSNVGPLDAGPWAGRKCIGCSLVVGPDGRQVLLGPYGEDADVILHVQVTPEPRPARGDGWERWWRTNPCPSLPVRG
jgi:predicted amidohydrolase